MAETVEIPKDIAIRLCRFMDIAGGEGLWFRGQELFPDELDAADIVFEWAKRGVPDWWPEDIKDQW